MYEPSKQEFLALARQGNTIPVYRTLLADHLTPVLAFQKLLSEGEQGFLLESVVGLERVARYTFLGVRPRETVRTFGNRFEIVRPDGTETLECPDPLAKLGDLVAIRDHYDYWGRGRYKGAVTIGVVVHGFSAMAGHGPGIDPILSALPGKIKVRIEPNANTAYYLGIRPTPAVQ